MLNHDDMAKLMGVCPNMTDLACLRTTGQPSDEPTPKNQIPNAQFFEKMHQSDLHMKATRSPKSSMISPTSIKLDASKAAAAAKNVIDDKIKIESEAITSEPIVKDEPQSNDDILQQKLSMLTTIDPKAETVESSFEATFLLQECIGGYPDPKQQITPTKRSSNKENVTGAVIDQTDVEGLIETHAVGRPAGGNKRGGGRKKGAARTKLNRKLEFILTL